MLNYISILVILYAISVIFLNVYADTSPFVYFMTVVIIAVSAGYLVYAWKYEIKTIEKPMRIVMFFLNITFIPTILSIVIHIDSSSFEKIFNEMSLMIKSLFIAFCVLYFLTFLSFLIFDLTTIRYENTNVEQQIKFKEDTVPLIDKSVVPQKHNLLTYDKNVINNIPMKETVIELNEDDPMRSSNALDMIKLKNIVRFGNIENYQDKIEKIYPISADDILKNIKPINSDFNT